MTGSDIIREGGKYHVSITSQGYEDGKELEIAIKQPSNEIKKNVTLNSGKTQIIEFYVRNFLISNCLFSYFFSIIKI